MKRGLLVVMMLFFTIPLVASQAMSFDDMFEPRSLSYSSDKVMVPVDSVFDVRDTESIPVYLSGPASSFYYAGDNLIATTSSGNVKYYYLDRLGDDMTSKSLPFGQPITINNMFSYTGKEFDEDLYYFGARYYDPNLGKFTSVDPVKDNHPYSYVSNDPMNLVDPDGKEEITYVWTHPTSGSPVEYYVGEGQFAQGPYTPLGAFDGNPTATFTIPDPLLATGFGFRVAGVDAEGRQGPWSETSDEYFGAPVSAVGDDYTGWGPLPPSYPNPASDLTRVVYYTPRGDVRNVKLAVYDIRGALVKEFDVDETNAGYHEIPWDFSDERGRDLASGVYITRYSFTYHFEGSITNEEGEEISKHIFREVAFTQKMLLLK